MNALRDLAIALLVLAMTATKATAADDVSQKALIVQRLHSWANAFNNRDLPRVCDLFARDMVATVPDAPNRNRAQVCANLDRVLAQTDRRLHYSSRIHEIIVSGNYAIVRLDWTLRVTRNRRVSATLEHGMDVFQEDRRGTWSIVRFIAFSDPTPPKA